MISLRNFLIKFDQYFGSLAVRCILPPKQQNLNHFRRVLIIRPGGIGDAVLLLPTIAAISLHFPDATIDVLAERRNAEVFTWCPQVANVWCYDHLFALYRVICNEYDLVIDSEQWYRLSAVVARQTCAHRIIGFAGNGREKMLTDAVAYNLTFNEVDSFKSLLSPLGVSRCVESLYQPCLPPPILTRAQNLLCNAGLVDKQYVVLFPGASVSEKQWPIERFKILATFVNNLGVIPVVVGGLHDKIAGERIVAGLSGVNLAGSTSLSETAAIIAHSAAFVSGDSGLLHIAATFGIPTVSLFGPSDWRKWGPRGEQSKIVTADCICSPCSKFGTIRKCSTKHCMGLISIEQVTDAVAELTARFINLRPRERINKK